MTYEIDHERKEIVKVNEIFLKNDFSWIWMEFGNVLVFLEGNEVKFLVLDDKKKACRLSEKVEVAEMWAVSEFIVLLLEGRKEIAYFDAKKLENEPVLDIIRIDSLESPVKKAFVSEFSIIFELEDGSHNVLGRLKMMKEETNMYEISEGQEYNTITGSDFSTLALQQKLLCPSIEWDVSQAGDFLRQLGHDKEAVCAKLQNVSGLELSHCEFQYLRTVLGITEEQFRQIRHQLKKYKGSTAIKVSVQARGLNNYGQLGLVNYESKSGKFQGITLPECVSEDYIKVLVAADRYSVFLTKAGRLFLTGCYRSNNSQQRRRSERKNSGKIDNSSRFADLTSEVILTKKGFLKVKEVKTSSNQVYLVGKVLNNRPYCLVQKRSKQDMKDQGKKFPSADLILSRLSKKKKNKNYKVVYEDGRLGELFMGVSEFMDSAVPYHKVKEILFCEETVWCKAKRFYKKEVFG